MEAESCVPPGFRFHPTEEELVGYYLHRKINSLKIDLDVIVEVDLYSIEPWDLQAGRCKMGYEEENEWYFFSHKDRKYPTGRRTNRATGAGFWKATGRDKAVVSKETTIIGMRKTLVFYKGRAPTGIKTDWIMHEYRLQSSQHGPPQEEGWVVCRAFKKPIPNQIRQGNGNWNNGYYFRSDNNFASSSIQDLLLVNPVMQNQTTNYYQVPFDSLDQQQISNHAHFDQELMDLPHLDSPGTISRSLDPEQDKKIHFNCYDDTKNVQNLFMPPKLNEAALMFPFPNMPLIPCDDDSDSQNHHMNHLFGCFPDL